MKRTGDWGRKKPLQNRTPPASSKPLSRTTPLPRARPQKPSDSPVRSKPLPSARPKVSAEERAGRAAVKARSGGRCEIGSGCRGEEMHHRKNRSQGGTWCPSNLLHLCSAHHLHATTHPAAARERGWAVRGTDDPDRCPVWLAGRGWHYLTADGGTTPTTERNAA